MRHLKDIRIIILAVLITTALLYIWSQVAKSTPKRFFMDEVTGEVSTRPVTAIPPLANAQGELTIVGAVYFGSADCKSRTLAYLEKYSPEAKAALEAGSQSKLSDQERAMVIPAGYFIRSPAPGSKWIHPWEPDGQRIVRDAQRANGGSMQICNP